MVTPPRFLLLLLLPSADRSKSGRERFGPMTGHESRERKQGNLGTDVEAFPLFRSGLMLDPACSS